MRDNLYSQVITRNYFLVHVDMQFLCVTCTFVCLVACNSSYIALFDCSLARSKTPPYQSLHYGFSTTLSYHYTITLSFSFIHQLINKVSFLKAEYAHRSHYSLVNTSCVISFKTPQILRFHCDCFIFYVYYPINVG